MARICTRCETPYPDQEPFYRDLHEAYTLVCWNCRRELIEDEYDDLADEYPSKEKHGKRKEAAE